jgi:PTH1 family peptidyl-tRNA hydrolase
MCSATSPRADTWLDTVLDAVADAAPLLAGGRPEEFMTRIALLTQEA